jgi:hypothetical protein
MHLTLFFSGEVEKLHVKQTQIQDHKELVEGYLKYQ